MGGIGNVRNGDEFSPKNPFADLVDEFGETALHVVGGGRLLPSGLVEHFRADVDGKKDVALGEAVHPPCACRADLVFHGRVDRAVLEGGNDKGPLRRGVIDIDAGRDAV